MQGKIPVTVPLFYQRLLSLRNLASPNDGNSCSLHLAITCSPITDNEK